MDDLDDTTVDAAIRTIRRLREERDAARQTAAYLWARSSGGDEGTALREFYASKGWSLPQEKRHE